MTEQELAEHLRRQMDAWLDLHFYGWMSRHTPNRTALRLRGNTVETVNVDSDGKVIEPCPYCGPVLLCSKHMLMVA